ncbi:hypothetical protein BDW22DRAFT_913649 [Trametopsis cervina]|nr:hypothetical protein BDW22DRAFT_913649 [Trametopsis cervina]
MTARPRSLSMGDIMRSSGNAMPEALTAMYSRRLGSIMTRAAETSKEAVASFVSSLPKLNEKDLEAIGQADSSCPICLNPFATILTEEEMALVMDSPAHPLEDLGVTKLASCGHVFCMKDIRNWVLQGHNSCPFCRHALIDLPEFVDDGLVNEVSALGQQMQARRGHGR